jgi:hypothetical protein
MATKPLLKQFMELRATDLEAYPVWVNCHTIDYNEPWYDETNEETFRPWTKKIPVDPDEAMFLIKSDFTLVDGTRLQGFITPVADGDKDIIKILDIIQPFIFGPKGEFIQIWFGRSSCSEEKVRGVYSLLEKKPGDVFPIKFEATAGLANGRTSGIIPGFCYLEKSGEICIKK